VYWGKFSKGEKAITSDVSGNPLRRRNYRTPPNEIIKTKDPYAGRKRSSGDRAYSGTFSSGHVSGSKRTEKAWMGDVSGQPIRKRSSKQTEVAGERASTNVSARNQSGRKGGIKPVKGAGGSISASGKYRSNLSNKSGGGSVSASGKYRSNQSLNRVAGSASANGKYRSNKPLNGRIGSVSASGQNRSFSNASKGGGSISASGSYRTNKPFKSRMGSLSVSGKNRTYDFKPQGSASGKPWNNNNKPLIVKAPGVGASAMGRIQKKTNSKQPTKVFSSDLEANFRGELKSRKPIKGGGSISGKQWNNNNRPIIVKAPGIGANAMARDLKKSNSKQPTKVFSSDLEANFRGDLKTREPKKGGGSVSGKLWNNKEQPIEVRMPSDEQATAVGYSGKIKLPFFKRAYVRNPNAVEQALKKESPYATVYMADRLQVAMKARKTGTKPKAVKGSMPGLAPTKATVKASEYSHSVKMYWSYKHNPSSADESQKTIAPTKSFIRASAYSGKTRLSKNYRHNPTSDKDALKVIAPGRAYARITDYQGNIKMSKYNDKRFLPDAKFAHSKQNNVKQERTMMTDFKLLWTKIFKKNGTQPTAVKEKAVRPRYDKRERELWPGLYD